MANNPRKEELWQIQGDALREPSEILCQKYEHSGLYAESLKFSADEPFVELLGALGITLFVTREYEHLVLALTVDTSGKLRQSHTHLPHPSGLVVDRKNNSIYIAATRNPNQIWEFKPLEGLQERKDRSLPKTCPAYLMPTRTKFMSGSYYTHDLALIGGELYGNSVGQNAITKIEFDSPHMDRLVWWPKSLDRDRGKTETRQNYIQLNSIAGGARLEESFFSASSDKPSARRPGHHNYPVDKRGVIFSGATRDVHARGLTRPHSARLAGGQIWVDNSGYGEFGYANDGEFVPIIKLPGWTRGLCIHKNIAFVGVSRVLPRFRHYAPGLKETSKECGLYAINIKTGVVLGHLKWPNGNQIFAIDWISNAVTPGFVFTNLKAATQATKDIFYSYKI